MNDFDEPCRQIPPSVRQDTTRSQFGRKRGHGATTSYTAITTGLAPSVVLRDDVVDVMRLTGPAREHFLDDLSNLVANIFEGYDREYLTQELLGNGLVSAKVLTIRNEHGALVGFNMFRGFEFEIDGRTVAVFRALAGLLPEYRGRNSMLAFSFIQAIDYKLRHPLRQAHFLLCALHPSSYYLPARYAHKIWPRCEQETPAEKFLLMQRLFAAAGRSFGDGEHTYVARCGKRTLQNTQESTSWKASNIPQVRHFLRLNPNYESGYGLVCLIPLTATNLLMSGLRFVTDKLYRKIKAKKSSVIMARAQFRAAILAGFTAKDQDVPK